MGNSLRATDSIPSGGAAGSVQGFSRAYCFWPASTHLLPSISPLPPGRILWAMQVAVNMGSGRSCEQAGKGHTGMRTGCQECEQEKGLILGKGGEGALVTICLGAPKNLELALSRTLENKHVEEGSWKTFSAADFPPFNVLCGEGYICEPDTKKAEIVPYV